MKKYLAAALILAAAPLSAQPVFVPADSSPLSQLCIAALDSRATLLTQISELGLDMAVEQELVCNGLSVRNFVKRARQAGITPVQAQSPVASPAPSKAPLMAIRGTNDSPETQLCVAAVTSPLRFETLKEELGADVQHELRCNGKPLEQWVRRYRGRAMNAAL